MVLGVPGGNSEAYGEHLGEVSEVGSWVGLGNVVGGLG
jgi:hypothetical protein